jgi:hypothetical protein
MVKIKCKWECPICQTEQQIPSVKPHWGQSKLVNYLCVTCLSRWHIKLTRVQGIMAAGDDITPTQTLIEVGHKATVKMMKDSIARGRKLKSKTLDKGDANEESKSEESSPSGSRPT